MSLIQRAILIVITGITDIRCLVRLIADIRNEVGSKLSGILEKTVATKLVAIAFATTVTLFATNVINTKATFLPVRMDGIEISGFFDFFRDSSRIHVQYFGSGLK